MSNTNKIIEGLKEALQFVQCEHDWEVREATTAFKGIPGKITSVCPYCGCKKVEIIEAKRT